jgi:lysosomal alpha-mannosidase
MGDDFNYMNALMYFKNTDKIISYINQLNGSTLNAFYSTPSQYLQAKLDSGIAFPTKTDDLFPYADGPHSYWTGYFTSRASFKRYVRESTNVHQNARQLQFLTTGAQDLGPSNPLYLLERAVGVTQHHDAVAGTAKQHVTWDYERRLSTGRVPAFQSMSQAFTSLTGYQTSAFAWCELSNVTLCPPLESGTQQVCPTLQSEV